MVILILAIFFILCVYPLISIHKNKKDVEEGIEIGREFDKNSLYEELQNRNFSYPLLKRIKKGYNGWPALEGRISTYIVYSEGTKIFVNDFSNDERIHREYFSLLDRKMIKAHIEKSLNGYHSKVDDRANILKIYLIKTVKTLCIATIIVMFIKGIFIDIETFKVKNCYLKSLSEKYTVEEVFNDFFYYTNWKYSSDKGEKYVTVNGRTEYNDETIEIDVKFKIKGDMYPIDSVYVNGKKIDTKYDFDILTIIFNGYE